MAGTRALLGSLNRVCLIFFGVEETVEELLAARIRVAGMNFFPTGFCH